MDTARPGRREAGPSASRGSLERPTGGHCHSGQQGAGGGRGEGFEKPRGRTEKVKGIFGYLYPSPSADMTWELKVTHTALVNPNLHSASMDMRFAKCPKPFGDNHSDKVHDQDG